MKNRENRSRRAIQSIKIYRR